MEVAEVVQVQAGVGLGGHDPGKAIPKVDQHDGIGEALATGSDTQTQQIVGVDAVVGVTFDSGGGEDEVDRHFFVVTRIGAKLRQRKTCRQMVQSLAVCIGQDGAVGYEGWIGLHDGLPIRQGKKNRQTGDVHRTLAEPLFEWV